MAKKKDSGRKVEECSVCGLEFPTEELLKRENSCICANCALESYVTFLHNDYYPKDVDNVVASIILGEDVKNLKQDSIQAKSTNIKSEIDIKSVPKPTEIKEFLDKYVVGQTEAKKTISVAVYNHYKRLFHNIESKDKNEVEIEKSNILLVGPTGTGKTLIAKSVARLLNVPFTIVDATVFTQAGYVGEDIESILSRLLQESDYDVAKAEKGIVFIDEIDKIGRKNDNPSITRDVGGEGVQQGMLKLLEGSVVNVPPKGGRKHPDQSYVKVNTQNILFICGGAFEGVERIIASRMNTKVVGYGNDLKSKHLKDEDLLKYVDARDLKSYGLIPEMLGRLPVIAHLDPLDRETLSRILVEPKNAIIRQYTELMKMDGIELSFTEEALAEIVEKAVEQKLGARGLRTIVEKLMKDLMFSLPSDSETKSYIVDLDYVKNNI